MVITNNILGMNAQRQFNIVGNKKKKSTEKLSSGFKINRAADDAAGLTISEKMRSQIRGLTQGVYNTQDGVSMCQVADGALEEVDDMLHRLTELAIKSANGTNTDQDREAIDQETGQILDEIDRISESTLFNDYSIFSSIDSYYLPISVSEITVSGVSNHTEALNYRVNANSGGIDVNGNQYDWTAFKDAHGASLDKTNIKSGQYTCTIDGLNLSFEASENATIEDVIGRLDGLKFNTKVSPDSDTDVVELVSITGNLVFEKKGENNNAHLAIMGQEPGHGCYYVDYYIVKDPYGTAGLGNTHEVGQWTRNTIEKKTGIVTVPINGYTASPLLEISMDLNLNKELLLDEFWNIVEGAEFVFGDSYFSDFGYGRKGWVYNITGLEFDSPKLPMYDGAIVDDIKQTRYKGQLHYTSDEEKAKMSKGVWIQSGCKAGDGINLEFDAMNTSILGIDNIDLSTIEGARLAISDIEGALDKNNANRSKIGAQQNRLEHTIDNENNIVENTTAAESRIRDTDMAKESANLAVQNILTQAGVAMMAQANQSAQGVMRLFQ